MSDDVGGGIVPMHPAARAFRDLAGIVHQRLAAVADEVVLARRRPAARAQGPSRERGATAATPLIARPSRRAEALAAAVARIGPLDESAMAPPRPASTA